MKVYLVISEHESSACSYETTVESAWVTPEAAHSECERRKEIDRRYVSAMDRAKETLSGDELLDAKRKIGQVFLEADDRAYCEPQYSVVETELAN